MNRGVTWSSFATYLTDQQASSTTILNVRNGANGATSRLGNGVGEVNGLQGVVSGNRVIQLAVKIYF